MDGSQFWVRFVLAALATWRLTHLVAVEDGPADIVLRLRSLLARSMLRTLTDCFGCLSLWIAAPFAFFVSGRLLELLVTWLALSGAAFLLEQMRPEPLVVERFVESAAEGSSDGMLRPEANANDHSPGRQ
jgi:hypothetical protein